MGSTLVKGVNALLFTQGMLLQLLQRRFQLPVPLRGSFQSPDYRGHAAAVAVSHGSGHGRFLHRQARFRQLYRSERFG